MHFTTFYASDEIFPPFISNFVLVVGLAEERDLHGPAGIERIVEGQALGKRSCLPDLFMYQTMNSHRFFPFFFFFFWSAYSYALFFVSLYLVLSLLEGAGTKRGEREDSYIQLYV